MLILRHCEPTLREELVWQSQLDCFATRLAIARAKRALAMTVRRFYLFSNKHNHNNPVDKSLLLATSLKLF